MKKPRWHNTFIGAKQQHTYWLYKVIDDILVSNPQIGRFIEIGTGQGALSIVLGLHSLARNTKLLTFDTQIRFSKSTQSIFDALSVKLIKDNCFTESSISDVIDWIGITPTFIFCDGDDKPREFNTFSQIVPRGSVIAAHDYSVEIKDSDIEEAVKCFNLRPLCKEEWIGGIDDIQTCFYYKP